MSMALQATRLRSRRAILVIITQHSHRRSDFTASHTPTCACKQAPRAPNERSSQRSSISKAWDYGAYSVSSGVTSFILSLFHSTLYRQGIRISLCSLLHWYLIGGRNGFPFASSKISLLFQLRDESKSVVTSAVYLAILKIFHNSEKLPSYVLSCRNLKGTFRKSPIVVEPRMWVQHLPLGLQIP